MKKARNTVLLNAIAFRIKEIRESQNITQEVFYNDTGINVGRIEKAKRDISVTTLSKICEYLGITLPLFFKNLDY
ncbi:MAG: helix-turn-helix transcriptional regulator [Bacteroidia bacterium]|nr:helix-turn-helix transcriptional regulator [Bacteroidia bacterium]